MSRRKKRTESVTSDSDYTDPSSDSGSESDSVVSQKSSGSEESDMSVSDLDELLMSTNPSAVFRRKARKYRRRAPAGSGGGASAPPAVKRLIGEAHNAFLSREYETAIDLLNEAIRLCPGLVEPFLTLATIYEETGDRKRQTEALTLAAHLKTSDVALWRRVAELNMQISDYVAAIYALSRASRSSENSSRAAVEVLWQLAWCYDRVQRPSKTVRVLRRMQPLLPEISSETEVSVWLEFGKLMGRSLFELNKKQEASEVLELVHRKICGSHDADLHDLVLDVNLMNMLAEVFIDLREYLKAAELLSQAVTQVFGGISPEVHPEILAKLAVASCHVPKFQPLVSLAIVALQASSDASGGDAEVLLPLAETLVEVGNLDEARTLLQQTLQASAATPESLSNEISVRIGLLAHRLQDWELARKFLAREGASMQAVAALCEALRALGLDEDADQLAIERLRYDELKRTTQAIPEAMSNTKRRQILDRLLRATAAATAAGATAAGATAATSPAMAQKFSNSFLALLWDCELDVQRVAEFRASEAGQQGPASERGNKVRRALNFQAVEEMIGDEPFMELLAAGVQICSQAGKATQALQLLEEILVNKRKKYAQRLVPVGAAAVGAVAVAGGGGSFVERMEFLIYSLGKQCNSLRFVFKYLRKWELDRLSEISELLFNKTTGNRNSGSKEHHRQVLDQRAWILRSLAKKFPENVSVVLFLGHLAVYSQNFRYAVAEYSRACLFAASAQDPSSRRLRKFAFLCLAACSASLAMSRRTTDRHLRVLQGWAALNNYAALHLEAGATAEAEVWYNRGRYLHQLSQWTLAVECYSKALQTPAISDSLRTRTAYALYALHMFLGNARAARATALSHIAL